MNSTHEEMHFSDGRGVLHLDVHPPVMKEDAAHGVYNPLMDAVYT
jgi:hypothetical protein